MSNEQSNGNGGILLVKKVRGKVAIYSENKLIKNENVEITVDPPQSFYGVYKDEAASQAKRHFRAALIQKAILLPAYNGRNNITGDIKDLDNIRINVEIKQGSAFKEKPVINMIDYKSGDIIIEKHGEVNGIYLVMEGVAGCDESGRQYGDGQERRAFGFLSKANDGKATVEIKAVTNVRVKMVNFKFGRDEYSQIAEELLYESAEIAVQLQKEKEDLIAENKKLNEELKLAVKS